MKTIRNEIKDGSAAKIEALTAKATLPKKTFYADTEMYRHLDATVRLTNFKKGVMYAASCLSPTAVAIDADDLQWLMEYTGVARVAGLMSDTESARFDGIYAKFVNKGGKNG